MSAKGLMRNPRGAADDESDSDEPLSGRGMSGFGGKAGKGAVGKKRKKKAADASESDSDEDLGEAARSGPAIDSRVQRHCGGAAAAGPPAPTAATRQTKRTAKDSEYLVPALLTDKARLCLLVDNHEQTIENLQKELAAAKAELDCHRGNRFALEKCTARELTKFEHEAFNLARSCAEVQHERLQNMVDEEYKQKKKSDSEFSEILECAICYHVFRDAVMIPCGHSFCDECLRTALRSKKECPSCKESALLCQIRKNFVVRQAISARSTMPKTDHEAGRRKKYAAEHAAYFLHMDKKYRRLCDQMETMAKEALKHM